MGVVSIKVQLEYVTTHCYGYGTGVARLSHVRVDEVLTFTGFSRLPTEDGGDFLWVSI